ncbi:MAG: hypothetical protein RBS28_02345 [Rhodocyclaceae bacterium]|jgi:thiosulfate/3-mercaptopyruvate sulfurtransferase|nr:hypothetical protein [Rhodocyclaceae bacterium]
MRFRRHFRLLGCCLLAAQAWAAGDLAYTGKVGAGETVIDTRPLDACRQASLPGARCLPPAELLGPARGLPSERDLLWLFGTLGLTGGESVLVAGDTASGRDFVAGLLHLSGQQSVRVLDRPLTPLLSARADAAPGETRALVRTAVYTAPMRDALWIVHPDELAGQTDGSAILAADAYTAIIRFTRHVAAGKPAVRVGWNLSSGSLTR